MIKDYILGSNDLAGLQAAIDADSSEYTAPKEGGGREIIIPRSGIQPVKNDWIATLFRTDDDGLAWLLSLPNTYLLGSPKTGLQFITKFYDVQWEIGGENQYYEIYDRLTLEDEDGDYVRLPLIHAVIYSGVDVTAPNLGAFSNAFNEGYQFE